MMTKNAYYGIEILRFLRRREVAKNWTKENIKLVVTLDRNVKKRLADLFKKDAAEEDNARILERLEQIKEGVNDYDDRRELDGVLGTLHQHGFINIKPRVGVWITERGMGATLYDVVSAFGVDLGDAACAGTGELYSCPLSDSCRIRRFYEERRNLNEYVFRNVTLKSLAERDVSYTALANEYLKKYRRGKKDNCR